MPRDLLAPIAPRKPRDLFGGLRTAAGESGEVPTNRVADAIMSTGTGLARFAAGTAGLKGDLDAIVGAGFDKLGLGKADPRAPSAPTSADATQAIESVTGPLYEPQTPLGEYFETGGEFLPGLIAGPGGLFRRAAMQVALPAAGSEAAGQATEDTALEPYARVAGALLGAGAPSALARVATPLPTSPARQEMVETLAREGVTSTTAGQRTGRPRLQYRESEMGGPRTAETLERGGEQFTGAALRRIGETADRATPEVLRRAGDRIGREFDRLEAQTSFPLDQQLQNDLLNAASHYESTSTARAAVVEQTMNRIADIAAQNGGMLQGEAFKNIRSEINRAIRSTDTAATKSALHEMQESLDDAIERHMPADVVDDWRNARRQYRNLLVIEKAATGAGSDAAMGIISPAKLRQAASGQNRRAYVRGTDDFSELTHAGQAIMTPLPNSGTPGRLRAQGMSNAVSTIAGALLGQHVGDVPGAIAGATAGWALPAIAGRATMSPPLQAYLANQRLATQAQEFGPSVRRAMILQALMAPRLTTQ